MDEIRGQVVIVGTGPGISSSVARVFALTGHPLMLIARDCSHLAQIASQLRASGAEVTAVTADASRPNEIADVIGQICSPIASLVYNAAGFGGPLLQVSPEGLRSSMEVNLHAPEPSRQFVRPSPTSRTHGGSVLITGGGLALTPLSEHGVTSVGKSALRTASIVLHQELEAHNVRLITITVTRRILRGTPFDPDDVADVFLKAHQGLILGPEILV